MPLVISALVFLAGATAAMNPANVEIAEPDPKIMSQAEIRAFNQGLARTHKYYIRCKRGETTGSFIRREFSCRTNEQWVAADVLANQEARDIGQEMQSKSWRTSDDPG